MDHDLQSRMAEKIRAKYEEEKDTGFTELKHLDARVKRPARIFGWVFGSAGALIMGSGMSLIMTDIGNTLGLTGDRMLPGLILGVTGMLMALINYPVYKGLLQSRRRQYAQEVIALSDRIAKTETKL